MIKFLAETEVANEVRSMLHRQGPYRMAVAFWGEAAIEELALGANSPRVEIVCNLTSGGTNPATIKELIKAGHKVRSDSRLHAKIYLCGDMVVIGSSNASANGLGLEGDELAGWIEGNISTDDRSVVQAAGKLFERSLRRSVEIDCDLLKAAALARARHPRPEGHSPVKGRGSLFKAIRAGEAEVGRLPIRFIIELPPPADLSKRAQEEFQRVKKDQLDPIHSEANRAMVSCWEGWPSARPGTYYVDFGPRGGLLWNCKTPAVNHIRNIGRSTITLAYECQTVEGFTVTRFEARELGRLLVAEQKKTSRNDWSLPEVAIMLKNS